MRIKKKAEVIPFPQTLAFRLILLTVSIALFLVSVYQSIVALRSDNTNLMLIFVALTAVFGFVVFYNMDHLKDAKISPAALKRMKRRS